MWAEDTGSDARSHATVPVEHRTRTHGWFPNQKPRPVQNMMLMGSEINTEAVWPDGFAREADAGLGAARAGRRWARGRAGEESLCGCPPPQGGQAPCWAWDQG